MEKRIVYSTKEVLSLPFAIVSQVIIFIYFVLFLIKFFAVAFGREETFGKVKKKNVS